MTLRLVLRTLALRPVRTAVLACGFGLGIGVMAALLGVGQVVLEQATAPGLSGGGDAVLASSTGEINSARHLLARLTRPPFDSQVLIASPGQRRTLYLVEGDTITPVRARAGVPSLERSLGDPETSGLSTWVDNASDRRWTDPQPSDVLRAMDRFHPIPDVPERSGSWAEWLYFNGRARDGSSSFYLTFLVGPAGPDGLNDAGVRLQLERPGRARTSYFARQRVELAAILATAPDLSIAGNTLRLEGTRYRIVLDLSDSAGTPLVAELSLDAKEGAALPPLQIRGANGWVSGYVVPVLAGSLEGELSVGRAPAIETLKLSDAAGYHDHNWGFWEGVSWQWGQVAHADLSFVFGRVKPPGDAADADSVPGFLAVTGPRGMIGSTMVVSIDETWRDAATGPQRILVKARGQDLSLRLELDVEEITANPLGGPLGSSEQHGLELLQLRAHYRVNGTIAGRRVAFEAPGAAETFRRNATQPAPPNE